MPVLTWVQKFKSHLVHHLHHHGHQDEADEGHSPASFPLFWFFTEDNWNLSVFIVYMQVT